MMYQRFQNFFKDNKTTIMIKYDGLRNIYCNSVMIMSLDNTDDTLVNETDSPISLFSEFFDKSVVKAKQYSDIKDFVMKIWMALFDQTLKQYGEKTILVLSLSSSYNDERIFLVAIMRNGETLYNKYLSLDEICNLVIPR